MKAADGARSGGSPTLHAPSAAGPASVAAVLAQRIEGPSGPSMGGALVEVSVRCERQCWRDVVARLT
jgi:hypothetical protein